MRPPASKKAAMTRGAFVPEQGIVADIEGDPGPQSDDRNLLAGRGYRAPRGRGLLGTQRDGQERAAAVAEGGSHERSARRPHPMLHNSGGQTSRKNAQSNGTPPLAS